MSLKQGEKGFVTPKIRTEKRSDSIERQLQLTAKEMATGNPPLGQIYDAPAFEDETTHLSGPYKKAPRR